MYDSNTGCLRYFCSGTKLYVRIHLVNSLVELHNAQADDQGGLVISREK